MIKDQTTIKKRKYGVLDEDILAEALAQGKTKAEAGRLAGSKAKNPTDSVNNAIHNNPKIQQKEKEIKKDIVRLLEEKRFEAIEAMTKKKADKSSYTQLATTAAILTDKIQLLQGSPTAIVDQMPRMVIEGNRVSFVMPEELEGELKKLGKTKMVLEEKGEKKELE